MRSSLAMLGAAVIALAPVLAAAETPPEEARVRVDHHLREAARIADHFDDVVHRECPRFATPAEWDTYLDGEVERLVLLVAHLDQAWVEAKTTRDDDVRRTAKAPRRRLDEARSLAGKLQACAEDNGTTLSLAALWARVEREAPRRQAEIALPH